MEKGNTRRQVLQQMRGLSGMSTSKCPVSEMKERLEDV